MPDRRIEVGESELTAFRVLLDELVEMAERAYAEVDDETLAFDNKVDGTRVTTLDTELERQWRDRILARFPSHSIVGEELGQVYDDEGFCWYLDPVDGTDDLTRGIPLCGYLVALAYRRLPIVAAIGHPRLKTVSLAVYGQGASCDDGRLPLLAAPADQSPAIGFPAGEDLLRFDGSGELMLELVRAFPNHRTYRNAFGHTSVINGGLEAAMELDTAEWDVMATRLLIEEVGGSVVWFGDRIDPAGVRRVNAVFGVREVVDDLLGILSIGQDSVGQ